VGQSRPRHAGDVANRLSTLFEDAGLNAAYRGTTSGIRYLHCVANSDYLSLEPVRSRHIRSQDHVEWSRSKSRL